MYVAAPSGMLKTLINMHWISLLPTCCPSLINLERALAAIDSADEGQKPLPKVLN
jgi:hypothetical protein